MSESAPQGSDVTSRWLSGSHPISTGPISVQGRPVWLEDIDVTAALAGESR